MKQAEAPRGVLGETEYSTVYVWSRGNTERDSNDEDKVDRNMELVGDIRTVLAKGGIEREEEEFEEVLVET